MTGNSFDLSLFVAYLIGTIALGLWVARRKTVGARDYFLAGDRLPWYAIGGSIIAANISTEHFIGMVGAAYAAGFVLAQWEWGNWFTFSVPAAAGAGPRSIAPRAGTDRRPGTPRPWAHPTAACRARAPSACARDVRAG